MEKTIFDLLKTRYLPQIWRKRPACDYAFLPKQLYNNYLYNT